MQPYDWMLKKTPQTEWIKGQGLFICFAFFLGGISGGLYLISLYFDNLTGMFAAWLLALAMGGFYTLHLGQRNPLKIWRMVLNPRTSWISRGLTFVTLFIGFTFIQLCLSQWAPGPAETVFKVLAGIVAFAQSIYTGFALSYVSAIKFWNSALLPLLFVTCGLVGGTAILLAINLGGSQADIDLIENITRVLLGAYIIMIAVYLIDATYVDPVSRGSVLNLVRGSNAMAFWGGIVFCGLAVPVIASIISYFAGEASSGLLIFAVVCEVVGGFSLRYAVLKEGVYAPLIRTNS
jgi:polysulfide reductase chain C